MAGGKLQGLPTQQEMAEAARRRGGPLFRMDAMVKPGVGKETASLLAILDALDAGLRVRPRGRGRQFGVDVLRRAAKALHAAGVPVTSGEKGRGPAVVAKALSTPLDTARSITRRLAALMPEADRKAARVRRGVGGGRDAGRPN